MAKFRVYEIAKKYNKDNKEILEKTLKIFKKHNINIFVVIRTPHLISIDYYCYFGNYFLCDISNTAPV